MTRLLIALLVSLAISPVGAAGWKTQYSPVDSSTTSIDTEGIVRNDSKSEKTSKFWVKTQFSKPKIIFGVGTYSLITAEYSINCRQNSIAVLAQILSHEGKVIHSLYTKQSDVEYNDIVPESNGDVYRKQFLGQVSHPGVVVEHSASCR